MQVRSLSVEPQHCEAGLHFLSRWLRGKAPDCNSGIQGSIPCWDSAGRNVANAASTPACAAPLAPTWSA